jgi:hypothetical protein
MSNNAKALRRLPAISVALATSKRVQQPGTLRRLGCWWDLRYPTHAK